MTTRSIRIGALLMAGALGACATRTETTWSPSFDFTEPLPDLGPVHPASERAHQRPVLHVALALSGGGHRAANFGLGVMLGLEETVLDETTDRDLLDEVDLLSSVSGGGFAAAAYVGSLRDFRLAGGAPADYLLANVLRGQAPGTDPGLRRHLERGYTGGIFSAPFRSTRLLFDPTINRTDAFEETVDDMLLGAEWRRSSGGEGARTALAACMGSDGSLRLADVFVPTWEQREVLVPHWAINATAYENGAIVPLLPGTLMQYGLTGWQHRLGDEPPFDRPVRFRDEPGPFDRERWEARRDTLSEAQLRYHDVVFNLPLAVGVTASANFPGVLPPTNLFSDLDPLNDQLLLLDGGVADNLGALTALRLLERLPADEPRVLVVVDAANGPLGPFSKVDNPDVFTVAGNLLGNAFLGTWHGRVETMLRKRCDEEGITLVYLSFEDLMDPEDLGDMKGLSSTLGSELALTDAALAEVIADSAGPLRLPGPRKPVPRDPAHPQQNLRPFELLRAVPTDFQCTNVEQRLLLAAGRQAVAKHVAELLAAVR